MKKRIILCLICLINSSFLISQNINKENILNAEKLLGLEFNDAERDSMLDYLNEQLSNYQQIRKFKLENSIPPSIIFNPIPVNFNLPDGENNITISDYSSTTLPDDINDLAFYSIGQLAHLIKTRQISSTELTRFFLERLKKFGDKLHCVITITEERALRQAALMDYEIQAGKYRGLLHGIPFGVKDLLSTKDYKTTWGSVPFKDQMINEDATVISKLEDAGAVLCAKFSMGELAWGDVWFGGKTRTPWDTSKGSSGSSAGSASAVSAGLIPFSIGTETYGSIISPSTVCGVTGLRPTYGRVSRTGAMALSWSMDKIGPICRTAEDLAIVFSAIIGADNKDQTIYNVPFIYNPDIDLKKLRIGYLKNDFDKQYDFHKNDSIAISVLLKLGVELIPIKLPEFPVNDLAIILSAEAAAAFDELTRSNKDDLMVRQIKNAWPNSFRASRFIPAVEYINANRIRYLLIQEMNELFRNIDLYIAPSWEGNNLLLTNLTGHPAVVIPTGFMDDNTPASITFIGNLFDEGKIVALAKAFQDATDFHKKHPPLFIK